MATGSRAHHDLYSSMRNVVIASAQADTNGSSAPDGVVDPGEYFGAPTYAATGQITFPLNQKWGRVVVVGVEIESTTVDSEVNVRSVTDGLSAANTVVVQTYTPSTGAALESNNETIHLTLALHKDT